MKKLLENYKFMITLLSVSLVILFKNLGEVNFSKFF